MKVYRLEHKQSRVGHFNAFNPMLGDPETGLPFPNPNFNAKAERIAAMGYRMNLRGPWEDGLGHVQGNWDYKYAVTTKEVMARWFDAKALRELHNQFGIIAAEYDVAPRFIEKGYTQVAFLANKAKFVREVPLEELGL